SPFRSDWLSDKDFSQIVKIERVKHYADLWRTVAVSATLGYLAIVIQWNSFLWNIPSAFVADNSEKLILSNFGSAGLAALSMYVLFGIVYESFNKANKAADLLLEIKSA